MAKRADVSDFSRQGMSASAELGAGGAAHTLLQCTGRQPRSVVWR